MYLLLGRKGIRTQNAEQSIGIMEVKYLLILNIIFCKKYPEMVLKSF